MRYVSIFDQILSKQFSPDLMPRLAASDPGLNRFHMSHKMNARHIRINKI